MGTPIHVIHVKVVRSRGDVGRLETVIFEALEFLGSGPQKNEDNTGQKKEVGGVGLFKETVHLLH
jgi:hypothetical protein